MCAAQEDLSAKQDADKDLLAKGRRMGEAQQDVSAKQDPKKDLMARERGMGMAKGSNSMGAAQEYVSDKQTEVSGDTLAAECYTFMESPYQHFSNVWSHPVPGGKMAAPPHESS